MAVIGGAGHVGLGLCLTLAEAGHHVFGLDIDEAARDLINAGRVPFREEGAEEALGNALESGRLEMTGAPEVVAESDVVIIVPGTPVDENLNPRLDALRSVISTAAPYLHAGQLIILRSTISPGTTHHVNRLIERHTGMRSGVDFHLVYAPERVVQGRSLVELPTLPQLIGAFDEASFEIAREFFETYVHAPCILMSPVEAELGKLITNMARYVNFAFANEVYMLAETWDADANRIIDGINRGYPRLNIARPGPNVGGPCLYKDGHFLVERIAFPDLIRTAFQINEGMPAQVVMKLDRLGAFERIAILGMTFKAESDDTRNSLSFKLKKLLDRRLCETICVDPYLEDCADWGPLRGAEAAILMTPHQDFKDLARLREHIANDDCVMVDLWGHWGVESPTSQNGVFTLREAFA